VERYTRNADQVRRGRQAIETLREADGEFRTSPKIKAFQSATKRDLQGQKLPNALIYLKEWLSLGSASKINGLALHRAPSVQ
jgi:hypothetical protein